jgi:hypothetical protein
MATLLQWETEVPILRTLSYDVVLLPVNRTGATASGLDVAPDVGLTRYEDETRFLGRIL